MRAVLFLATILIAHSSFAADRVEKIRLLMEAQGQLATFEQQMRFGEEARQREAAVMVNQIMKNLNPNEQFRKKFSAAADDFIKAMQPPWSVQDVVEAWAKYYGGRFSDEELDQLLAFYTTPIAQKEVVVGREALVEFGKHFQDLYKPVMEQAAASYLKRMEVLAKECRCKK